MRKYILTFSFIVLAQSLFAQDEGIDVIKLKCTYLLTYQQDSIIKTDILKEEMILFVGNTYSEFCSKNSFLRDSMINANKKNTGNILANLSSYPKTKFTYNLFKNYPKGEITTLDNILKDKYKYSEIKDMSWDIKDETANISGYKCQKATTKFAGRNYEAWFTNEIPINEGPYKFSGLPGLIIKISDAKNHYVFELIRVYKPKDKSHIVFPGELYYKTTKKEFMQALKENNDNIIARLSQAGITLSSQEDIEKIQKNTKARNNPIELKF